MQEGSITIKVGNLFFQCIGKGIKLLSTCHWDSILKLCTTHLNNVLKLLTLSTESGNEFAQRSHKFLIQ